MRFAIAASCLISALTFNGIAATQVTGMQTPMQSNAANAVNSAVPQVGEIAPSFSLQSQSGKQDSLSTFKGKWVVLYFYPEDFTSGCTLEAHNFQRDAEKFAKLNAIIVGVSVDSVDSHKQFCAKEGLNVKLLSDVSRRVSAQYGSLNVNSRTANRNTFLISPTGKIARVWINVTPAQHSREVLAAIESRKQG
jgi:thioredoxin-dependent peroxiredoxin